MHILSCVHTKSKLAKQLLEKLNQEQKYLFILIKVKSGYIVLPCGAGKTLLGISLCTKISKETMIVCSSD